MSDSLPVVERVYNLTEAILDFIVDINSLKSVTVLHIFNIVTQIQHVIAPLLARQHITPYLLQCLLDTETALLAVRRNLNEWNDGRSKPLRAVITRRSSTKELKEDRDHLITNHSALQGAVQLVSHFQGYNILTPTSSIRHRMENKSVQSLKMKMKMTDTDQASIYEADQYWRSHFGDESTAESEEFFQVLSLWMGEPFKELAIRRLFLRLDEANTGYISFATFQAFVRHGNVRETVNLYTSDPCLPLLIWIDDDEFSIPRVVEATKQGITVIQFVSTAAVKAWVMINEEFLKKHVESGQIRFVMNQTIYERNDYNIKSSNDKAGYQITRFVRERKIKAPILIYTSKQNLHLTRYVEDYDMVGSMCGNYLVFQAYLAALAGGRKDDIRWMRYNA